MTRKRFNGLLRYWIYLMNEDVKKTGRTPTRMYRQTARIEGKVKNSYQNIWRVILASTPSHIREQLPEK